MIERCTMSSGKRVLVEDLTVIATRKHLGGVSGHSPPRDWVEFYNDGIISVECRDLAWLMESEEVDE